MAVPEPAPDPRDDRDERPLATRIEGFLRADGFELVASSPLFMAGQRAGQKGEGAPRNDIRLVWIADPGDRRAFPGEEALSADFARVRDEVARSAPGSDVQSFLVVPSLAGFSTAFRQHTADVGVSLRVPVQFFDTPYRHEEGGGFGTGEGSRSASVTQTYIKEHQRFIIGRVPQPFVIRTGLGRGDVEPGPVDDLFRHLLVAMTRRPERPLVRVVAGAAGVGKSVLFGTLFAALYHHFMDEKRHHRLSTRPILFLPDHIRHAQIQTMQGLLASVAETDAAAATRPELFRWLHAEGLTRWMFDGLDEFYAGETDFVAALRGMLASGRPAEVLICTRDSLLSTSSALRTFLEEELPRGHVEAYELATWGEASKRALAWRRLEGRAPSDGEADTPAVAGFVARLASSPALAELTSLPFYADLTLRLQAEGRDELPADEFALLALAINALVDREAGKLAFGWKAFAGADSLDGLMEVVQEWGEERFRTVLDEGGLDGVLTGVGRQRLIELLEELAHMMRCSQRLPSEGRGLSVMELEQLGDVYAGMSRGDGATGGIDPQVLLALVQFAFFGAGAGEGEVRFTHELIADFLAARHAVRQIRARPEHADTLGQAVGVREDLGPSLFLRYLVRELGRDPALVDQVRGHVAAGRIRPAYRKGAGQLAAALG